MAVSAGLRRSGSKAERIATLVGSNWSDETLLCHVGRADLIAVARRVGAGVSGVKTDLIQRLISWAKVGAPTEIERREAELVSRSVPQAIADNQPEMAEPTSPTSTSVANTPPSRPPVPAGYEEIVASFPDLGHDEHVVLALAKEARSLSEQEIDRIVQRHQLGWFLTKAHMADLLARLDHTGQNPFRVRSAGDLNIYEWHGVAKQAEQKFSREAARDLVDALRNGVVPERHLDLLVVGQDAQRSHLVQLLDRVRAGKSVFKLIRAPYGGGKTFVCAWLRDQAFQRDFALSTVRIGPDQPLSDLPVFFAGAVNGLRTPEKRDASALADVLESWLLAIHRRTAQVEGLQPFDPAHQAELARLVEQSIERNLERIAQHDPGLAPALKAFYRARVDGDARTAGIALAWIRGTASTSADELRTLGVRGQLSFKWHGDVSQTEKLERLLRRIPHVLLTTPESLEAILLRKARWREMFAGLQAVLIDEAHNFAGGDRGGHVLSLLARLEQGSRSVPQRIALSATVGNVEAMLRWLVPADRAPASHICGHATAVDEDFQVSFFDQEADTEESPPQELAEWKMLASLHGLVAGIGAQRPDGKSRTSIPTRAIVFVRSRRGAETYAKRLGGYTRAIGARELRIRTHHSAVSKFYREEAERLIQVSNEGGIDAIVSTSTLELGIDIGELNRVIQCDTLTSPSSFLQRVGRTGRRPGQIRFFRGLCLDADDLLPLVATVNLGRQRRAEALLLPRRAFHRCELDFLDQTAAAALKARQQQVANLEWHSDVILVDGTPSGKVGIWTYAGDRINRTLARAMAGTLACKATASYRSVQVDAGVAAKDTIVGRVLDCIHQLRSGSVTTPVLEGRLAAELPLWPFSPFAKCLPRRLHASALAERTLDVEGLLRLMNRAEIRPADPHVPY